MKAASLAFHSPGGRLFAERAAALLAKARREVKARDQIVRTRAPHIRHLHFHMRDESALLVAAYVDMARLAWRRARAWELHDEEIKREDEHTK